MIPTGVGLAEWKHDNNNEILFKKRMNQIILRKNLNEFQNELMLNDYKIVPKLLNFLKINNAGEYVPLLYSLCTRGWSRRRLSLCLMFLSVLAPYYVSYVTA